MDSLGTLTLTIAVVALLLSAWAFYDQRRLLKRFSAAFANLDSDQNLADTITEYFAKIAATDNTLSNLRTSYKHLASIGAKSLQKAGLVRFNPFSNTGGDQSFVLALLDNHDSGFLLTSIHGREGTRIYIKAIEYGSSKHPLSNEESAALAKTKNPELKKEKKINPPKLSREKN